MKYIIGHGAYSGANALAVTHSKRDAIHILLARGIILDKALHALELEYSTMYVPGTFDVVECTVQA